MNGISKEMDIFIKTLTGSVLKIRASPNDTILNLKKKIQRSEGIPVVQQHLIYQSKELVDSVSLKECNISSESHLQLVLGMKGGPINTRRVSIPFPTSPLFEAKYSSTHSSPRSPPNNATDTHATDIHDHNKEIVEEFQYSDDSSNNSPIPPNGFPITFLIVKSGDQINLFKIFDWSICDVPNCCDSVPKTSDQPASVDPASDNENCDELDALTSLYLSQLDAHRSEMGKKEQAIDTRSIDDKFLLEDEFDLKWSYYSDLINIASQDGDSLPDETLKNRYSDAETMKGKLSELQNKMKSLKSKKCSDIQKDIEKESIQRDFHLISNCEHENCDNHKTSSDTTQVDTKCSNSGDCDNSRQWDQITFINCSHNSTPDNFGEIKRMDPEEAHPTCIVGTDLQPAASSYSYNQSEFSTKKSFVPKIEIRRPKTTVSKQWSEIQSSPTSNLSSRIKSGILRPATSEAAFKKIETNYHKRNRMSASSLFLKSSSLAYDSLKIQSDSPLSDSSEAEKDVSVEQQYNPHKKSSLPQIKSRHSVTKRNYFSSLKAAATKSSEIILPDVLLSNKVHSNDSETQSGLNILSSKSKISSDNGHSNGESYPSLPVLKERISAQNQNIKDKVSAELTSLPLIDSFATRAQQSRITEKCKKSIDNVQQDMSTKPGNNNKSPKTENSSKQSLKRKQRCKQCHKKISIINSYACRCGNLYCSKHRYSEVHQCSYDYKEKGRKYIKDSNPVVTAPKLPKI